MKKKTNRRNVSALERFLDGLEPVIVFLIDAVFAIITFPFKLLKHCFIFARRHMVLSCVGFVIAITLFVLVADSCSDGSLISYAAPNQTFAQADYYEDVVSSDYSTESEAAKAAATAITSETSKIVDDPQVTLTSEVETEACDNVTNYATASEPVTLEESSEVETSTPDNQGSSPYILTDSESEETVNDSMQSGTAPLISDTPTTVVLENPSTQSVPVDESSTSSSTVVEEIEVDEVINEETDEEPLEEDVLVETETTVATATASDALVTEEASDESTESSDVPDWTNEEISRIAADMGYYPDIAPIAIAGMKVLINEYGYTREGAAGLMGNAFAEATYFVGADNGSHFGIFQWDYSDRWPRISAYLEEVGCSRTSRHDDYYSLSLEEQIEVFKWQLRASQDSADAQHYQDTISYCRSASDAQESANQWRIYYEGCGDQAAQARRDAAVRALNLYNALYSF